MLACIVYTVYLPPRQQKLTSFSRPAFSWRFICRDFHFDLFFILGRYDDNVDDYYVDYYVDTKHGADQTEIINGHIHGKEEDTGEEG